MKIWLEAEKALIPLFKECKDCSRATTIPKSEINLRGMVDTMMLQGRKLVQSVPLYISECHTERWLVCHPTGKGHLAVIDQEAMELLNRFRDPVTFSHVVELELGPFSALADMFMHFLRLGWIAPEDAPSLPLFPDDTKDLSAWLHVTNACNLRCSYCYISKTTEHMQEDVALRSIDAIFRSADARQTEQLLLKYAGGEASLLMPRVFAIHDYAARLASERGIQLSAFLLSNGVALSDRSIEGLKARGIGLMISLDGIGAAHDRQRSFIGGQGSFKQVERTLDRLSEHGLIPHISVTISQRNLAGLPELITYLLDRALPFSLNYYRDNECSTHLHDLSYNDSAIIQTMHTVLGIIEERLPEYSLLTALLDKADPESPHQRTCGVGQNYLVVDQQGGIAKCHADISRTVTTIHDADPLRTIQMDRTGLQNVAVDEKEGCRSCQWKYWCSGGCPLLTQRVTGRTDIKSPNCGIYQALFPQVLRLEALRILKQVTPLSYEEQTREEPSHF